MVHINKLGAIPMDKFDSLALLRLLQDAYDDAYWLCERERERERERTNALSGTPREQIRRRENEEEEKEEGGRGGVEREGIP